MTDKPWKQFERTVASFFGTERNLPTAGKRDKLDDTDVVVDFSELPRYEIPSYSGYVIECKQGTEASRVAGQKNLSLISDQTKWLKDRVRIIRVNSEFMFVRLTDFDFFYKHFMFGLWPNHRINMITHHILCEAQFIDRDIKGVKALTEEFDLLERRASKADMHGLMAVRGKKGRTVIISKTPWRY